MKYLLLFACLYVIWWIWSKRNAIQAKSDAPSAKSPVKMITCAYCGVYFPENDGVIADGRTYCCEAHHASAVQSR